MEIIQVLENCQRKHRMLEQWRKWYKIKTASFTSTQTNRVRYRIIQRDRIGLKYEYCHIQPIKQNQGLHTNPPMADADPSLDPGLQHMVVWIYLKLYLNLRFLVPYQIRLQFDHRCTRVHDPIHLRPVSRGLTRSVTVPSDRCDERRRMSPPAEQGTGREMQELARSHAIIADSAITFSIAIVHPPETVKALLQVGGGH